MARSVGQVKKRLADRGFSFITQSDGAKDVFFHCSQLRDPRDEWRIDRGSMVSYDLDLTDRRGPRAIDVVLLDGPKKAEG